MVSLQGNAGLLAAGLAGFAGTRRKSNKLVDRDLTAGMNAKQLGVGGFALASSDWASSQVKNQFSPLGAYSDEAIQIGLGMGLSEASNRMDSSLMKPAATGVLLSGIGGAISQAGVDAGSLLGNVGGGGGTESMPTTAQATGQMQGLHNERPRTRRASTDVVDY